MQLIQIDMKLYEEKRNHISKGFQNLHDINAIPEISFTGNKNQ